MDTSAAGRRGTSRGRLRTVGLILLLVLVALPASAQADPVEEAGTRIFFDPTLSKRLEQEGIGVPDLERGRLLLFSEGSEFDFGSGSGLLAHDEAIKFTAGGRSVRLRSLVLDTTENTLRGKLGRRSIRIASAKGLSYSRYQTWGGFVRVRKLSLSGAAAALLNRKLRRPGAFVPGRALGTLKSYLTPDWLTVAGGTLQLSLDPNTFAKLEAVGVRPEPFEAALTGSNPTVYSSPVIGGRIDLVPFSRLGPRFSRDIALVESGIRLVRESPSTVLVWTNLGINAETGESGRDAILHTSAGTFFPPTGPLAAVPSWAVSDQKGGTRTIIALGPATLKAGAANAINETFAPEGQPVVAAGDPLGTFSVVMQGP